MAKPDIAEAKRFLSYDPLTGVFTRKVNVKGRNAGEVAGGITDRGYVRITVCGCSVRAHHLAWAFAYGEYPDGEIDHADRNRANNAIENLRPATRSQQIQNRDFSEYNTSGATGVYRIASGRWRARVTLQGKCHHLGYFDTRDEAAAAYDKKASELFGEFKV